MWMWKLGYPLWVLCRRIAYHYKPCSAQLPSKTFTATHLLDWLSLVRVESLARCEGDPGVDAGTRG